MKTSPSPLDFGRTVLRFDGPAHIMGIINCTPDSFSDGGDHLAAAAAIEAGLRMVEQGAAILDVGGESTRPGAAPVGLDQELGRVLPVIEALRARTDALISIDTTKAAVASAALEAGADLVNDVSGLALDPQMRAVVAARQAPAVLMHMRGTPRTMQADTRYGDVVDEVTGALGALVEAAAGAGIERRRLIVDPGIGFGKDVEGNLKLIRGVERLAGLGLPVLVGPSRKRFIGALLGLDDPRQRIWGTAAAVAMAIAHGAHIIRVHDVGPMAQVAAVASAIARAES